MNESSRVTSRRTHVALALPATLMMLVLPTSSMAAPQRLADLPTCEDPAGRRSSSREPAAFSVLLDDEGVVAGHELELADRILRVGPRAFASQASGGRLLVGERSDEATLLTLIDTTRSCRLWSRTLGRAAYDVELDAGGRGLRYTSVDPRTRRFEGRFHLDAETGQTEAMLEGACLTTCEPNDGDVAPAAFQPVSGPRPVPVFSAGGWPRGTRLPYRWHPAGVPPEWAREPLRAGAADASTSGRSRAPSFEYGSGATDTIRYTSDLPSFCRYGIACAWRDMPAWWTVFIRPHGTDFSWGLLRWCQKQSVSGCFDVRRVMIHELGHVMGLDHPENAGFRLPADDTVMNAVTPARPADGSSRHTFGRCDVAALQALYDVPDNRTAISRCLDLAVDLRLSASAGSVRPGSPVVLTATLSIEDRDSYGHLGGNPLNGRSVKLRYRPVGGDGAWNVAWMQSTGHSGRYEVQLVPPASLEFEAFFPAPDDEGLRTSRSSIVRVVRKES